MLAPGQSAGEPGPANTSLFGPPDGGHQLDQPRRLRQRPRQPSPAPTTATRRSARSSITVNCGALAITKVADAPSVSAGSPIGYVVTVTNTGPGALTWRAFVTDTPADSTPRGLSWSYRRRLASTGTCPGMISAGGVLELRPGAPGRLGASVHVHCHQPDDPSASCAASETRATAVSSTNDGSASVGPVGYQPSCAPTLRRHQDRPTPPASAPATRSATRSRSATPRPRQRRRRQPHRQPARRQRRHARPTG